ncbi:MAG TPA: cation-transporting P-type ATPase, partial [Flavisolibacter sp.]|nr:cation-transporting P-type ATPase [Flavisolibacter sp.]
MSNVRQSLDRHPMLCLRIVLLSKEKDVAIAPPVQPASREKSLLQLQINPAGLTRADAQKKLLAQRKRKKIKKPWVADAQLLIQQFKSPLILLLVFAAVLSAVLGEYSDTVIVLAVLFITG